jgi:hypothetical protein
MPAGAGNYQGILTERPPCCSGGERLTSKSVGVSAVLVRAYDGTNPYINSDVRFLLSQRARLDRHLNLKLEVVRGT